MSVCWFPEIPQVHSFLDRAGVHAYFSLSWVITWFAHDIFDLNTVARLFDVFLSSPPTFPLYLSAAIVLHRKESLLQTECDFALVHDFLSHIPADLPYDEIVCQAQEMFIAFPPDRLVKVGDRSLPSLMSSGQVACFVHPPSWYQRLVPPDWMILMERRKQHNASSHGGRSRGLRSRRRRAVEASSKASSKRCQKIGKTTSQKIRATALSLGVGMTVGVILWFGVGGRFNIMPQGLPFSWPLNSGGNGSGGITVTPTTT